MSDANFANALKELRTAPAAAEVQSCSRIEQDQVPDRVELIAQLKARGLSHGEIASAVGITQSTLLEITSSTAFRKRLLGYLTKADFSLEPFTRAEGINSLVTLVGIRDDETTPRQMRVKCAEYLADRAFGKPTQTTIHEDKKPLPESDAAADAELAQLEREFSRLKAN